jgi:hypothetical protein
MVELLGRVISPSQGLYLHRTTLHRKTKTNIHALSGIRTHDPSNQPTKTQASDRTVTAIRKLFPDESTKKLHGNYESVNLLRQLYFHLPFFYYMYTTVAPHSDRFMHYTLTTLKSVMDA